LTLLLFTVLRDDVDTVKFLIDQKADLTLKDVNGSTVLKITNQNGKNFEIEKLLLEAGAKE